MSVQVCNGCAKHCDSYARGLIKTAGKVIGVVFCGACIDKMYRKVHGTPAVETPEDESGCWSTATWDSD